MERAIDFLLKSQANLEARIEQGNMNLRANIEAVNKNLGESIAEGNKNLRASIAEVNKTLGERIAQTDKHLGDFADTQADLIREMTHAWERQGEFNNSMKASHRELTAAQKRTDATVEKLARTVNKLVEAWGNSGRG
jgi:chromosome segregation ATPase